MSCRDAVLQEEMQSSSCRRQHRYVSVSDDPGGKSLSEKSKTECGQCVGEKSTGAVIHSNAILSNASIFEDQEKQDAILR